MGEIVKFGGASFNPSAANTGNEQMTVLRGRNMMLRGSDGSFYFETYGGHKNLNESIPMIRLTGTIAYTDGEVDIIGSGTAFKSELRFGQKFIAGNPLQVFVVDEIISDTEMRVQREPDATESGEIAYKPAHLFPINNQRGTLVWGNAIKWDRGNITAVGEGRLRINGEPLAGEDLVATRRLQLAIYDPVTNQYSVDEMGFDTVPLVAGVSVTVVAGGTRDQSIGLYSFRYMWADSSTGYGFSNPSDVIKTDAANVPIAITAANQRFALDFSAGIASKPDNADAIIVLRSLYSDPTQNPTQAAEGSWFVASTVKIANLEAGDILYIDVLDGELGTEVTFDNDPPPEADWHSALAGDPVMISCYGDTVPDGDEKGASPGPYVSPSRRGNRHGFPAATATVLSPPEMIIGFLPAVGRLFLMTRVGLPFAASTGQSDFPIETRAFWQTGFKSPYGLVFVNDTLYAFTFKGPTKSIATGDTGSEQFAFAAAVEDITKNWHAGYVHTVHDQANELVLFIYSAAERNAEGFWISLALPLYLRHGVFGPLIEISKPGRDMIVTGAAAIGGHVQFLAGGRGNIEAFSSEEPPASSSEEPPVALLGGIFCCGGECAHTDSSNFDDQAHLLGTGIAFDTGTVRSGKYSIKFDRSLYPASNTAMSSPAVLGVGSVWVGRLYINFETYLTADSYIIRSGSSGLVPPEAGIVGIAFNPDTNTLHCATNLFGFFPYDISYVGAGFTPALHVWYRIDFKIDRAAGTVDATITPDGAGSGTDLTQATYTANPVTIVDGTGLAFGMYPNFDSGIFYIDDMLVSNNVLDFPIGEGYVHGFVPTADGAHNITAADRFERGDTGTDITNATTDAFELINNRPFSDNEEIKMVAPAGPTDYVEVKFGAAEGSVTPTDPPRAVQILVGAHQTATADFAIESQALLRDNNTSAVLWTVDTPYGFSTMQYQAKYLDAPPSGGDWVIGGAGDGDFNNLEVRLMTIDQSVFMGQYFSGVVMEAEFAGEE